MLDGRAGRSDPSATLALRDLWAALPSLAGAERRRAEALLARPTDGAADPYGFGYTVGARSKCAKNVCLHWVPTTIDAPPSKSWVKYNLKQMQKVWRVETGRLGYRKPLKDGHRGGNKKFDVYLKDVGSVGLYGYCAAETRIQRFLASGYCVLDNDFSTAQFPSSPKKSLKVTAAHEFFHAVQYAYDAEDDRWLLEATATWMEERVADGANDNRQYLPYGQVKDPYSPLDTYGGGALNQYGNWAFFEFLSKKYGTGIVRQIWSKMAADKKSPDLYSTQAVVRVLKSKGGFVKNYAEFAAGNTVPGRTYPEGGRWPSATLALDATLTTTARSTGILGGPLNHLTSSSYVLRPDRVAQEAVLEAEGEDRRPAAQDQPGGVRPGRPPARQDREALREARRQGPGEPQDGLQQPQGHEGDDHPRQRVHPVPLLPADELVVQREPEGRRDGLHPQGRRTEVGLR